MRSPCCARAASGHAAAPPRSVMKVRLPFNHLVGAGEQRRQHFEAERLRGGQIDYKIEFSFLLVSTRDSFAIPLRLT